MPERIFTIDDQNIFAQLSGDYNKLHIDEIAARRYLFGGMAVHGIHMVLWALDKWLEASPKSIELISLRVIFRKNLRVGDNIEFRVINEAGNCVELELYADGQVYVSISAQWKPREGEIIDNLTLEFPPYQDCKVLLPEGIAEAGGELGLYIEKNTIKRLFPNIFNNLSLTQIAELLATTRLVGMECPGFNSIFFALDVDFEHRKLNPFALRFKVANFDKRFLSSLIDVEGKYMKGTIKAFLRPLPAQQDSFSDLCRHVSTDEFKGQRALIIGGSRGLGEVSAKLLAAGGANVMLTYFKGREDAKKTVEQIVSGKGNADFISFNALNPHKSQIEELLKFSPTHIYYFATPYISINKGMFSAKLFKEFCDYYVSGFSNVLNILSQQPPFPRKVFYPSSEFVETLPLSLGEYAVAKAAGEALCLFFEKSQKFLIHKPRLPKMATDQTVSIMGDTRNNPAPIMLKELRDFKNYFN